MPKSSRQKTAEVASEPKTDGTGKRSLWQGSIAFGLVQIPVRMVNAERSRELTFHQLDRKNGSRIRYERINEETGEKVDYADVVKGYELDDGSVVVLEDADFEKAAVDATHTIDITDFVERAEIPPQHFERPYFLLPNKTNSKAYSLVRDVLAKRNLVAVGLVVIRTRQHLCAILPEGPGLVLEILRFEDELVSPKNMAKDVPAEPKITEKERSLAEQLVESLTGKWEPKKYKDVYREELLRAIEHKAKTGKMPAPAKRGPRPRTTDLVALLQKSVARGSKKKAA